MFYEWRVVLSLILLSVCGARSIEAATTPEFVSTPHFFTGGHPDSIATADIDGDGRLDIITAGLDGEITVLLGDGKGGLGPSRALFPGQSITGVAAGDFNGDHRPDLVFSNGSGVGGFNIRLNKGDGHFMADVHIAGGSYARSIAVGDFDHDGKLDVALADDSGGGLIVFLGHGDGTFATPKFFSSGTDFRQVLVDDVNHDGKLDLVASTTTYTPSGVQSTVQVFLGLGNGNFSAPQIQSFIGSVDSYGLGDFNGDGKKDLAVGLLINPATGASHILVLPGRGDGTFAEPGRLVNSDFQDPVAMVVHDFDGDGHLDLMVASYRPLFAVGGDSVNVLFGKGNGTFGHSSLFSVGLNPNAIALGDFNNDGKIDAAVLSSKSLTVSILVSTATGSFNGAPEYASGLNPQLVLAGDLNGDKNLDLVVLNSGCCNGTVLGSYSVLKGNGDGTFQQKVTVSTGTPFPTSGVLADFNGDEVLDLAIADPMNHKVHIYLGKGDATFAFLTSYVVGNSPFFVINADLNKDGHQDLVVASDSINVLLGTGGGFFQSPVSYPVEGNSVAIADLNGDGHLDLAVANISTDTVSFLIGAGNGTFSNGGTLATGSSPGQVVAKDLNQDGSPDLIVIGSGSTVSVFLNDGLGGFSTRSDYAVPLDPAFIVAKDLNGDGAADLAVACNYTDSVTVLLNNGSGLFEGRQDYWVGSEPDALTSGDFNHDGSLDLAVTNFRTDTITLLINTKH